MKRTKQNKSSKKPKLMPTVYPQLIPISSTSKGIKVSNNIMYKDI